MKSIASTKKADMPAPPVMDAKSKAKGVTVKPKSAKQDKAFDVKLTGAKDAGEPPKMAEEMHKENKSVSKGRDMDDFVDFYANKLRRAAKRLEAKEQKEAAEAAVGGTSSAKTSTPVKPSIVRADETK